MSATTRMIRVISTFVQTPQRWRSDVAKFSRGYRNGKRPDLAGGDAMRIRRAAATAELWGLPVGVITGVREEEVGHARPDRDTFWFNLAAQYATRATCPRASIGAVLVKFDRLIGAGMNGAPEGEPHCLERDETLEQHLALEHCEIARHAEINALRNALLPPFGATLYVIGPRPVCPSCADRLREAGVTDIRHRPLSPILDSVLHEVIAWQRETFKGERLLPAAVHLLREVREIAANPADGEEHADALMLAACVLDRIKESATRRGIDLMAETARKFAINRQRTWGEPDEAGVIEHVREAAGHA